MEWLILPIVLMSILILDLKKHLNITKAWHTLTLGFLMLHAVLSCRVFVNQLHSLQVSGTVELLIRLSFLVYGLYYAFRMMLKPVQQNESDSIRISILFGGQVILKNGVLLFLEECLWRFLSLSSSYFADQPAKIMVADGITSGLMIVVLVAYGSLRIVITCRRLGIIKRLILISLIWIPVVNLFVMRSLCHAARAEYDHACYKAGLDKIRANSEVCKTKYPLVMVHGLGFRDLKYFNYWGRIPKVLIKNGAKVYYGHQEAWGSIEDNAKEIRHKILEVLEENQCEKVNIIAHSKGGLDSRYMISKLDMADKVASLTTISTPHRGSELIPILRKLPERVYRSITSWIDRRFISFGDHKPDSYVASRQLDPEYAKIFNQEVPDAKQVYYQSYATIMKGSLSDNLLSLPHFLLRLVKGENDGMVCIDSAKWGNFKGVLKNKHYRGISHGDIIDLKREDYKGFDVLEKYVEIVENLKAKGF